jgi:hypothetical protein
MEATEDAQEKEPLAVSVLRRLRAVAASVRLDSFAIPITVRIEDSPARAAFESMGGHPYAGLVQIIITTTVRPRPLDGVSPTDHLQITFNNGIDFYSLAKMTDREMAMLIRENVVIAVVHEIDEHLLVDGKRLVEPHPDGRSFLVEGPWPEGVWRGRRLSPPR